MNSHRSATGRAVDMVIRANVILTMNGNRDIIDRGAIAIDGGHIVSIGRLADIVGNYVGQQQIDVGNAVALPGFVDIHAHLPQPFLRGKYGGVAKGSVFLPFLAARFITPDRVAVFGRVGVLEALRNGTTTVLVSFNDMAVLAEVVEQAGIRAILAEEVIDMDYADAASGVYTVVAGQSDRQLTAVADLFNTWHGKAAGRIVVAIAPLAPDLVLPETYERVMRLSDRTDILVTTHLAQSPEELEAVHSDHGTTPVEYLHRLGVLGPRTVAAHCVHATEEEHQLLRETRTVVAHCPRGYLLEGTTAPLARWLREDVRVGFGTDDVHHNMWETIHAARYGAAVRAAEAVGSIEERRGIDDYELLELVTIRGASALGMSDEIGSLEVGKKADLQIVDLENPSLRPTMDVVNSLVLYGGNPSMVFVDGRIVYSDSDHTRQQISMAVESATVSALEVWRDLEQKYSYTPR